jgi:hypothetical protein
MTSARECSRATNFLHLLKKVLAEQQDASGSGEDNGVLSETSPVAVMTAGG